jgi:DNA helicase-2/ATP-dependent DNA helicase PcrA
MHDSGGSAEELLVGLTSAQRAAVTSPAAPLCILASAGAGKTRVLTRRIAYRARAGTADPRHTLALTFTRKAAGELQDRLRRLGFREQVSAGTFHALASAQLHRWWADRGQRPPAVLDRKVRLLAPLAASRPALATVPVGDLAGHIEWAKARLVSPHDFAAAARAAGRQLPSSVAGADIAGLYARYEDEKVRRGLIDFDDMLARCADAIEGDAAFAGVQRWRWRHVFVDEFQDLNPLQHRLLLAWLGSSTDLCVVGDPHQAVYGWNGADSDLLAQVPKRWPSTEVLYLDDNHRCTPQIVVAAAAVLGAGGTRLRSAGEDGPPPTIHAYTSETAESHGIAAGLQRANAQGRRWQSMAVLTRTNAQLIPIQKALTASGVPYWSPGQRALLHDPSARAVLDDIRRRPRTPMQVVVADLAELAERAPVAEEVSLTGGAGRTRSAEEIERQAVIAALVELARTFYRHDPDSVAGQWLGWLPTALSDDPGGATPADAVTLCSFHRAKGLEWDAVWVAGLEQGLVPIGRGISAAAEQEERRLLYVALTRAAIDLHCSWAQHRTFGTRLVPREASPWLELVRAAAGGAQDVAGGELPPPDWRGRLRDQRRQLHDHSGSRGARSTGSRGVVATRLAGSLPPGWPEPDPDLVGSLRTWRSETARASGVPAYVVLHDVTLAALAALRPGTLEELLSVPGLGPVKAGRYGPTLLSLLSDRAAAG